MKVAVTAWRFSTEGLGQDLAAQGEVAEALGFDSFWLPENHFTGPAAIPSPLMLLAAIASRTSRIRLGSTSYLLPIRNPILAAEEVAVLDRLSGGRVILGIGRGFADAMFKTFDIPTKEKRKRFKENLSRMIDAWEGKAIAQHDDNDIFLSPLPVQRPHPPLWVAAFGPLAIKQAGSLGLPYIASPVESMESLASNISAHREHVSEAGHDAIETVPIMRTVFITENARLEADVRSALEKESASQFRDQSTELDRWAIVGDPVKVKDLLSEYQEQLGLNYLIARGRIQGVEDTDQVRSHEMLMSLADSIS
ncbi:MAG: LLM class flavin-dependent oxidoreductase [Pseudomonadales bacterium]|nr:LLM class flavin-dependent oxidoreductase [Pseudomonadales bacterium]MBO6565612.1 LLM class flavin-dependent oxidoreductase [Pseudomonadales bacterium]MBO6594545.1 LLM class flavin-dependent oxidoreductase [Pseudomonadales bacterium]MBO6821894.1 LLM class flavin-dependent oxidoreductase [Pseudomonadales bacterium]